MSNAAEWDFWIDTGGTFTDCLGKSPEGVFYRAKVLSSSSLRASILKIAAGSLVLDLPAKYPDHFFAVSEPGFTVLKTGLT